MDAPTVLDWINVVANVIMAMAAVAIPLVIFCMQNKFDEQRRQIGDSNAALLKIIDKRIDERVSPMTVDEVDAAYRSALDPNEEIEGRIYEFVCVKIIASTNEVAEYVGIDPNKASELLIKLSRVEGRLKQAVFADPETDMDCVWQRAKISLWRVDGRKLYLRVSKSLQPLDRINLWVNLLMGKVSRRVNGEGRMAA